MTTQCDIMSDENCACANEIRQYTEDNYLSLDISSTITSFVLSNDITDLHHVTHLRRQKFNQTAFVFHSFEVLNQLLQQCTARTVWCDSVIRSASIIKLVSVLFGKCTTLVVMKY